MEYRYLNDDLTPDYLHTLNASDRKALCGELREKIISTVSKNGGHLASNLGCVELTVALLSVFNYKKDKIVFDVGHQSYSYKLLTGRFSRFDTLRQQGGISGFPRRSESPYDAFDTGHSSTSVSAALGMARARDLSGSDEYVIAVIGDGAMTGGLAYEAINDLGHSGSRMIVILNDNEMSIDKNVGGMSRYLKNLRISSGYISAKRMTENFLVKNMPVIGKPITRFIIAIKNFFRFLINKQVPSMFEDLGLIYYGPIDGHDTESLIKALDAVKDLRHPVLLHVCTKKGKGYSFAENEPSSYHGVGPFDRETGVGKSGKLTYTSAFAGAMLEVAAKNKNVVGISAAMAQGTGMDKFANKFPTRFFDCGIAEEHAVTMAGGLSVSGYIPVVAIYSSFLQRAYDQIIHDVCFMNNHVVFAVDRSGFVGNDGHTHNGLYDITYLNSVPNMKLLSPRDYTELRLCMDYAVNDCTGPCAIRYPRGSSPYEEQGPLSKEKSELLKPHVLKDEGDDYCIVSCGTIGYQCDMAVDDLKSKGLKGKHISLTLVNPLPVDEILAITKANKIYTVEEGVMSGGMGEMLCNLVSSKDPAINVRVFAVTTPMIRAGSVAQQLKQAGLDADSISARIYDDLKS